MVDSRLAFDILAKDDGASAVFDKVARAADRTGASLKKTGAISDAVAKSSANLTAVRNKETDALDKVQVAESKLSDARQAAQTKLAQVKTAEKDLLSVRNDSSSSTSQIAAAETKLQNARNSANTSNSRVLAGEKALAKARREAAMAGNEAQKATKVLSQALDNEGKKAGKGFSSNLKKWLTGSGGMGEAGRAGGTVFGSGFLGVIKTPILGPAVVAAITAGVVTVMPAVGAVAAGALVTGFGAGLGVLGLVFAAKSVQVRNNWNRTLWAMASDMKIISSPFEKTLSQMADVARRTFTNLTPTLANAFKSLAPAMSQFGDDLGRSFEKLRPAIQPLNMAFQSVLKSLGPAMNTAMASFSQGLQIIAKSVQQSPTALSDLVVGVGQLFVAISSGLSVLNNLNEAFRFLPGNVTLVTRTMNTLAFFTKAAFGPFALLEKGMEAVGLKSKQASKDISGVGSAIVDSAETSKLWTQGLDANAVAAITNTNALKGNKTAAFLAGEASLDLAAGLKHSAHETHVANVAAALLAGAYDRQAAATDKAIDALNRLSGVLLSLSGAQIAYQQAVDDASQAIKDNGKTHDINTQKGRDNKAALDQVAASAIAQRDAMLKANDGNIKAAAAATASRASFVTLATGMGYTKAQAQAMAAQLIAIPNVERTAKINADIAGLEAKLATARTQLKDPNLTATKKAKLQAEIKNLELGIAKSHSLLNGLPVSKTAKLLADKKDLETKLAAAQTALKNPALTATKKAILKAEIAQLKAGIGTAQALINGLPGSKTVTITTRLVTEKISRTVSGASGGHVPTEKRAGGGPVSAGTPYLVGEKGPEIVVPSASGVVIPNDALKAGKGIVSGLAAGVRGGAGQAVTAAGDLANGILAKAREVLGISSPSKAFAQLGLWVNQGFSVGLKGSAKQVQGVMASLMSKVLDISYNAADTKKAISKTIASLNAALAKARDRVKPITHGMSKAQVAAAERSNRAVAASIRAIQAKLKSAKTDLANVSSIAARLGTTQKRNAIIGMLQRENVAMQLLANKRAAVANQLKAAQAKLAAAVQIRDEFKKSITDAALSFNAITNITGDEGRTLVAQDILAHMQQTLAKTKQFANQLASLKNLGLRGDLYKQIAEAGVDAGGATAAALLQGGKGAVASANDLQRQIANASAGLGNTAAKNMYQAGVDAAQGLVNGLLAKTKALDAASRKLANAIVAQIKKTLGIRSPSKVLEWHGAMAGVGFTRGIEGEYGRVQKAAAGLGNAATGIRSTPGRPGGGSSQLPLKVELVFKSDGSPEMNWLMGEVRKHVRINGGDVQKVLGSK